MKNSSKKINKKYIISLIAVLCIYVICQWLGIIEPQQQQSEIPTESVGESILTEYTFRTEELRDSHYEKHGMEMGFDSAEEYIRAANRVISDPDVLHKLEEEDSDHVYFLEETCEFVILSRDGYLRTYYIADGGLEYFNRQ